MSAILRPDMPPKDATILTLLAGVASATALRECTGVNVLLKWPNDLMVGRKKLGGILTEMRAVPDRIQFAVMGIGINVNYHVAYMPKSIRPIATSLAHEAGSCFSRSQILSALITSLDEWLVVLREEGKGPILTEWLKLSCTIGRAVSVSLGNTSARGVAQGLDNEGFLIIRQEDGTLQKVLAGDISHV
jgi:BirA family biotin operon repressor/biotin-[acetyl-CoA-carboxylase] ligase